MRTVYEKIFALTLMEKMKKDPEYAKRLGLIVEKKVDLNRKENAYAEYDRFTNSDNHEKMVGISENLI